jgi:capsule biosynthesis phosphatase
MAHDAAAKSSVQPGKRPELIVPELIVDVDGTLTYDDTRLDYGMREPRRDVIERVNALHGLGVRIIIYSARNMRTYDGNLGLINRHTMPVLLAWLDKHGVRFDEIYMGKPWCGNDGFYVQSRSMRPERFVQLSAHELKELISGDAVRSKGQSHGE